MGPLELRQFADERGVTMVQVAFGWLLAQPQVSSVIAGATSPEQLLANVKAGNTAFRPSAADLAEIDTIFRRRRMSSGSTPDKH